MSQFPTRGMTPPPMYNDDSTLRPYLTLPYLLSLTWLAYPILSLLFIVFRLQISSTSAQDAVNDAKDNLLVSCKAAQQAAKSAASLPTYMAIGTNKQFAAAANATMEGTREALILVLTCMEAIINFIIDIYRSTFLCFMELAIRGGISMLVGAANDISQAITSSLNSIRTNIQNDVSSFNNLVQSTVNGLNKIIPFGNPVTAPQLSVPDLSSLQNVTLPTTFQDALTKLNSTIPSLDQLRQSIESFVDTPFELVKADINNTFANISLDPSLLPIPAQSDLSFCDGMDTSVVDDLGRELLKIAKIGTGLLLIVIVLLLLGNCVVEWWKWRSLKLNLERTRLAWMSDPTVNHETGSIHGGAPIVQLSDHNLLTLHATSQHPLLTRLANQLSTMFNLSPSQYCNLQFFFHYVFHPPALACFLIGFFGLLSVELQLLAITPLELKFNDRASASVTDFTNTIASSVNASMFNQSAEYANGINANITAMQTTINDGLFGWVNGTTTTLNQTLNNFYSDVQNVVNQIFGGTVLDTPAQNLIQCLIGSKVDAFENALTFLHDNLHVNLPTVNESALLLSPDEVQQVSQPISAAAVGGGNGDQNGGLVGKLIGRYVASLKTERFMFCIFLGLWGVVVIIALLIIFWHSMIKPLLDRKKREKFRKDERKDAENFSWVAQSLSDPAKPAIRPFTPATEANNGFWASFRHQTGRTPSWHEKTDATSDGWTTVPKGTRKLRAIGRKSMGREVFLTDEEAAALKAQQSSDQVVDEVSESNGNWISRAFRRNQSTNSVITPFVLPERQASPSSSNSVPRRPNLTITTDKPSYEDGKLPVIDNSQTPIPGSAWSVSPNPETPRRLPWLHGTVQPSRHSRMPSLPAFKSFHKQITPTSTNFISHPKALSPTFISPRGGLAPRHPFFPRASVQPSPAPTMTPVTFLLESHRHGPTPPVPSLPPISQERNPFSTPFDDPPTAVPRTPKAV